MEKTTKTWTGRADYAARRAARIERLEARAERHAANASAAYQRARSSVEGIPFGQPNINGCLTPAIKRHDAAMRRSCAETAAAERAERAARAAENNRAISSDDPEAVAKLRAKLEKLERLQAGMKFANSALRMKDTAAGDKKLAERYSPEEIAKLRKPDFMGRIGFQSYMLSNNSAEIRRCRLRLEELERRANAPVFSGWKFDGGEVFANVEENRVQIKFDDIPAEDVRKRLKQNGFHWTPAAGVWQRIMTDSAIWAARKIVPASAAPVEASKPVEASEPVQGELFAEPSIKATPARAAANTAAIQAAAAELKKTASHELSAAMAAYRAARDERIKALESIPLVFRPASTDGLARVSWSGVYVEARRLPEYRKATREAGVFGRAALRDNPAAVFAVALEENAHDERAALAALGIDYHDDRGDNLVYVPRFKAAALRRAWYRAAECLKIKSAVRGCVS